MPNIAIIWDFDGTLTPQDSTTKTVEIITENKAGGELFWKYIKSLRGDARKPKWEHVLASDAPIWMYALSRIAASKKIPLNAQFFEEFVIPHIDLYPHTINFLQKIKNLEKRKDFQSVDLKIHHFIVSAGLKELVEQMFPPNLITWTFGCRYTVIAQKEHLEEPESVPVFCMDETMKTRSIFEISKGTFEDTSKAVNIKVEAENLWAPFKNLIYVGDGLTDVPSLSLTRYRGGMGIAVYDPNQSEEKVNDRLKRMRLDKRADLITKADFKENSELVNFLLNRCIQIRQRYEAEKII